MHGLIKLPAYQIADLIKTKMVSSEEVTRAFLNRIQEINPSLNAVIQIDEESSLQLAKKAELALKKAGCDQIYEEIASCAKQQDRCWKKSCGTFEKTFGGSHTRPLLYIHLHS